MSSLKLKKVAALILTTMITVPVFGTDITDGSIPCSDVAQNEEAYGCSMGEENAVNIKYKCLKALGSFEVPMMSEPNVFANPSKIKKGDKMIALGKQDGSIVFGDDQKDYKLPKDKIKEAIMRKFGDQARTKEDYKVTFQTLTGKITLKFKKKPGVGQEAFDLGKWEKVEENADSSSDDKAFVALGNEAQQQAQSSGALNNIQQSMDEKVASFPSKVDQKVEELEQLYLQKEREVDQNSDLNSMEKVTMKRTIRNEKQDKKNRWLRKKRNLATLRQEALRKCIGQESLISENVLRGTSSEAGGHGSSGIASAGSR
ncbi:MAG: hypothetical protein K9K67_12435 [Bacteriovoracaceae bacterium]|nr:hypothetical protein [Bacteriovoracaceae bacterium]